MTDHAQPKADTPMQAHPCEGKDLPKPPAAPEVPKRHPCTPHCKCPADPSGPPASCFDDFIRDQNGIVKKAERAKVLVEDLTAIQAKVTSAQADYTQDRYKDLKELWEKQDESLAELIRKVVCAVCCWECLLECRLCNQLTTIRTLEERLKGPGDQVKDMGLPEKANSLYDLKFWHERNVANLQARVDRIKRVLAAWEKPSETLGDMLEKNGKLIEDTQKIVATDPLKAVFDVFMTLVPRHWAIRPRDAKSNIEKYAEICECREEPAPEKPQDKNPEAQAEGKDDRMAGKGDEKGGGNDEESKKGCKCDEGTPDICCGPDAGILNMRQRLIGPLPYLVDPKEFPGIVCCLTKYRLTPASDLLAGAEAGLAAVTTEIEQAKKALDESTTSAIEAAFRAGLPTPFDCKPYRDKCEEKPTEPTSSPEGEGCPPGTSQPDPKPPDLKQDDSKAQTR